MTRYVALLIFMVAGVFMLAGEDSEFFAKYAILCAGGALIYFGASVVRLTDTIREGMGLDEGDDEGDG